MQVERKEGPRMSQALATIDAETGEIIDVNSPAAINLFGAASPTEVLLRAKEHADVLADVIKRRELYKVIKGKAHVFVDAWTLLGSMVGVFPVVEEVEPVEVAGFAGFKATVKAVTRSGEIVGRASAYCLRDENVWSLSPTTKDGKKLEPRNLHALASMAQTRATSKALKQPLGFIVQLAGYSTTPAEEMPDGEREAAAKRETVNKENNRKATKAQHAKLGAIIGELNPDRLPEGVESWEVYSRNLAGEMFGVESRADLTVTQMSDLIEQMQTADVPFG